MDVKSLLVILGAVLLAGAASAQTAEPANSLANTCGTLGIADGCAIIAEASQMLSPSYEKDKVAAAKAAFAARGYVSRYVAAKKGAFQSTTDVFLVTRPGTNRLFIVITGTESARDWAENAKYNAYTASYEDGQFYIPPGHAGFRRGMLNIINSGVFKIGEFDDAPLDCAKAGPRRSILSDFICEHHMPTGPGQIDAVIVGHSRGSGIGVVLATAVAGLEIKRPEKNGPVTVAPRKFWPLTLRAVIGFAPPYAIYIRSDAEAGMKVPPGFEDQWSILNRYGIPQKTVLFINDRDVVPALSVGLGRQFGHRYMIKPSGAVVYDGTDWGEDLSLIDAHRSERYCTNVLTALHQPVRCK